MPGKCQFPKWLNNKDLRLVKIGKRGCFADRVIGRFLAERTSQALSVNNKRVSISWVRAIEKGDELPV